MNKTLRRNKLLLQVELIVSILFMISVGICLGINLFGMDNFKLLIAAMFK